MSYLLDTHVLVWWLRDDPRLSDKARAAITSEGAAILVSSVSAFEIATKVRLRKFEKAEAIERSFRELIDAERFGRLPVIEVPALLAGRLVADHRDPFDRLLAAQALIEGLVLVTRDPAFASLDVETLW